ncbi:MAG TPA: PfkB family carbohydrate kinase [Solirubrobacteraceae bacterium]|nr:PfkB family carbohydrate kinase [Solirubrobacteraceae bacterium]
MRARIAVAGNINADITYETPRLPLPGETLLADRLTLGPGGKASNASVALARLGAAPCLLGSVGEDALGTLVLDALARAGVDTAHVLRRSQQATGVASVFVTPTGENAIVTHLGANLDVAPGELRGAHGPGAPFGPHGCAALLLTLGLPRAVLLELAAAARAAGALLVLDTTPLREHTLPPGLTAVDVLSSNRVEAEQLLGHALDPSDDEAVLGACAELRALGTRAVVLKLGDAGAAWASAAGCGRVAAPAIEVVDPTGAGDAFMAALTLSLVEGVALGEAVEHACLLGALSATGRGAQGGWTTLEDVRRFAAAVADSAGAAGTAGVGGCAGVAGSARAGGGR